MHHPLKYFSIFLGCDGSSLMHWFILLVASGSYVQASHCVVVSLRTLTLGMQASVLAACGFRSWGAGAWLLPGMWNLSRPGIEPMSPALVGEFLTTGVPGKSLPNTLNHL